ncbi:MAG TPA: ribonuclease PH [Phycisphaerae bacterium]|nr:ribonuclease PH [Phycisphaerae bacterium]HNU46483.1 ribonuclease PH [Phycisphaerae bacterium]
MPRHHGRRPTELRPVRITRRFTRYAPGSVLVQAGETRVLCTACWQAGVPSWRAGQGVGWVTAEYDMLPASTPQRRPRSRQRLDGRTQEIQRLIGRSLRAVVDLPTLGENSILIDCDVLQADGGTRTLSITGAYVAVCDAVRAALRAGWIERDPVREAVAAVSVGRVGGRLLLDLDAEEDNAAEVDMNVVMTATGCLVEVQGTGEQGTFTREELETLLTLATKGVRRLLTVQQEALGGARPASRRLRREGGKR